MSLFDQPIEHPSAWTGSSLGSDSWIRKADNPSDLADGLENGTGMVLLRGLDLHQLPEEEASATFLTWCEEHLGTPLSQSTGGELVFPVRDAGLKADDPRARGPNTNRKLSFHTDRCDVIAFLCWRQALEGGENTVLSSVALSNAIHQRRPDLHQVLRENFPYKRHTIDGANEQPWCEQPIFSERDGVFACAYLRVLIDRAHADPDLPSLSDQQIEALDFLDQTAEDPDLHVQFLQQPGDLLLLNNWVTLHRRSEFTDHDEPTKKRCLFRVWLSMPNSRALDPRYEANYGAVGAGDLRGGIAAR